MTESATPVEAANEDRLRPGREALARHAWQEAFELLSDADRAGALSGADLETLAGAARYSAHAELAIEIQERAYTSHLAEGNRSRAAYIALDVAHEYGYTSRPSIASAWARRGERLLEGEPESDAHGYLALVQSEGAFGAGNVEAAMPLAEQAVEIATREGSADLLAAAQVNLGTLKIAAGATLDGMALMEEASVAAINGELSPTATGVTCCRMIAACRDLSDYRRATEWTEATERYCERESLSGFPGVCRIHRAEVVALSGAWDRAEEQLQMAAKELAGFNAIRPLADGFYAIGEIRRLKGDFEGAETALREAHAMGRTPQPALALIRLAEGKVKAAAAAINTALSDETSNQWARARLLPAQVEIAVASGDPVLAREAATELTGILETYKSPALDAGRHQAWGRVLLAEGDAAGAARELRSAMRDWREVAAPYEVARSRALLARALRVIDSDDEAADLELQAAHEEFERLGARIDAAATSREMSAAAERRSGPVQLRKTFMFTDVEGSTNLAELLGNESWDHLLRWHNDTLRALITKNGGEVVSSTGDGYFAAFETAHEGLGCAVSIQQALADHRRSTGFAIPVRIGLHSARASRRGDNYSGVGVHLAARVAALAAGGEIVATAETLTEAGDSAASNVREVSLKGIAAPVNVASVGWA